ncbi:MAG TPA: hypothetical protein VLF71_03930 [Candidatus Saccharimonadales bacterium]|nr:hypothetical protein [Candidatus Saccharimonadales bacterium]
MRIKPYLLSVSFDNEIQRLDAQRWVISADVDIGDLLTRDKANSIGNKIRRRLPKNASLTGEFLYVVCSPAFKENPPKDYAEFIDRTYVQLEFDEHDATQHLESLINDIGEVTLDEFTQKIHQFLETEEWDYMVGKIEGGG